MRQVLSGPGSAQVDGDPPGAWPLSDGQGFAAFALPPAMLQRLPSQSIQNQAAHLQPPKESHMTAYPAFRISTRVTVPCSPDRKSTRLNSSHVKISYAVFCLKKKKLGLFRNNFLDA